MRKQIILVGLLFIYPFLLVQQLHGQSARKVVINHFVSDPKQNTVLYVTDYDGKAPNVTVTFYDVGGNIVGQSKMVLPENGIVPLRPIDVVKRQTVGNIRIESAESNVVAEYWQVIKTEDFSYSVVVPSHPAFGWEELIVQHFVSDPEVTSVIYLTNPQDRSTDVTLKFHDNNGNLVSNITRRIEANGTATVKPFEVIKRKVYGNVHISSPAVPIVGEYWQKVDTKVDGKEVKYVVTAPLQSVKSF